MQLVEEDQIILNFPPGSLPEIMTLFGTKLLKSATLKYALCLLWCQVEAVLCGMMGQLEWMYLRIRDMV